MSEKRLNQPATINLNAGPLSALFETSDGFLRNICIGGHEVLNGIYAAIRDENWDTIQPELSQLYIEQHEDSFKVSFQALCRQRHIHYHWKGQIEGSSTGSLTYHFDGLAKSDFMRNRIGFCILHPMSCAGKSIEIEDSDGQIIKGVFPLQISAHQPFMNIKTIRHPVCHDLIAEVKMTGDVFEMEDQRNWTDASYKTYCTPLAIPFPAAVKSNDVVQQSVELNCTGSLSVENLSNVNASVMIGLDLGSESKLPKIGIGDASHQFPISTREFKRLQACRFHHLRVDIDCRKTEVLQKLLKAFKRAEDLKLKLELALFVSLDTDRDMMALTELCHEHQDKIYSILIFNTEEKTTSNHTLENILPFFKRGWPKFLIGSGTNCYFTELNRECPNAGELDFICYSINPQVHAFDNRSLMETLPAQAVTVESARALTSQAVHITPLTLRPRFNPNATGEIADSDPDECPPEVDIRQLRLFSAAWTLGSLKHLSESQAASSTFYELTGWRGIMETEMGSQLPTKFKSRARQVFPMYFIFLALGEFKDCRVIKTNDPDFGIKSLLLSQDNHWRWCLTNTSEKNQKVKLPDLDLKEWKYFRLNESNLLNATSNPEEVWYKDWHVKEAVDNQLEFDLEPYEVIFLDGEKS